METFFMFGKYSFEGLKEISGSRTKAAEEKINSLGGEVDTMYALVGEKDLVLIVKFPDIKQAIKASIALSKMTGISFSTSQALAVEEFDSLTNDL